MARPQAGDDLAPARAWPLPATAAMPTISPARTSSDSAAQRGQPAVVVGASTSSTARTRPRPAASGARSMISSTSRPTIRRARSARRGAGRREPGGGHHAAAHHRDPVGDGQDLAELVADEHDAAAVGGHRPERPEQLVDLLRGEDRGRLVHDQDPGAAVEHLQDLDPLLLADRQLPDPGRRVDPQPERARRARRSRRLGSRSGEPGSAARPARAGRSRSPSATGRA